jgi:hypothetical protein
MKRTTRKALAACILLFGLAFSLTACQSSDDPVADGLLSSPTGQTSTVSATVADDSTFDFSYTDRDLDPSYDEATATKIALSGSSASIDGEGATANGSTVTISEEGTYIVSGKLSDGHILIETTDDEAKVQLVLDGAEISSTSESAILVEQADKVFITLAPDSSNKLSDGSGRSDLSALSAEDAETTSEDDHATHDGVIFSHDDLTINGSGSLAITSASAHAIVSKDDLVITGGDFTLKAAGDGLQGKDCVKIADGTLSITAGDDAITSTDTNEPDTTGFVTIDGGTITINAVDDAVHAETILRLAGGDVTVESCEEGYEGVQVWLIDGTHRITANDDGVNAAGDARTDYLLDIRGGYLEVDAEGDGLDSNGSITQSGGEVVVFGPTRSGNGAIDAVQASISGGSMIALGGGNMDMGYGSSSTQAALYYTPQQSFSAGSTLSLTSSDGTEIFSLEARKSFSTVAFSSPDLVQGGSYSFAVNGSTITSFTMSELVASVSADGTVSAYSGGGMGFGGGGMGGGGNWGGGGGGRGMGGGDWSGTPPEDFTLPEDGTMPQMPDGSTGGGMGNPGNRGQGNGNTTAPEADAAAPAASDSSSTIV